MTFEELYKDLYTKYEIIRREKSGDMKINRIELIEILDSMGIEYELDSETPGLFTKDDKRISLSSLKSPSEHYNCRHTENL